MERLGEEAIPEALGVLAAEEILEGDRSVPAEGLEANVVDVSVNGDREAVKIDLRLRSEHESKRRDSCEL